MNIPRLIAAVLAVTVFISIFDFIVHGLILGGAYGETKDSWRPEAEMMSRLWSQYLCYLMMSVGFVCIWALAFPGKGAKCGAIYGFLIGLISTASITIMFVFTPIPDRFMLPWFITGMLGSVLMGVVAALVYKPKADEA
jgi:hypothetical protein